MVHPSLYRSLGPVEKDLDGVRRLRVPVFIHRSQSMTRPGRVTARLKGRVPADALSPWRFRERGGQGGGTYGGYRGSRRLLPEDWRWLAAHSTAVEKEG